MEPRAGPRPPKRALHSAVEVSPRPNPNPNPNPSPSPSPNPNLYPNPKQVVAAETSPTGEYALSGIPEYLAVAAKPHVEGIVAGRTGPTLSPWP